ncbi:MAG: hypothetical protein HKO65_05695 [Gemmatimonadetes bacterium]|nr:hypothetical protein [Gemmatimonadota bacterium]NNM04578.1 hypothetical protein [Gemmatimonadota bacterium]
MAIQASMAQFDSVLEFNLEMIEVEGSGGLAYLRNDYSLSVIPQELRPGGCSLTRGCFWRSIPREDLLSVRGIRS